MKKLIRKIRGWFYVRSRQAPADQIEAVLCVTSAGIVKALALAVEARDDTRAADAKLHMDRIADSLIESMEKTLRSIERKEGGFNV